MNDLWPTPRDYVPRKLMRCRCAVGRLEKRHRELYNWVNSKLFHGHATHQQVFDRIEREAPGAVSSVSRVSYHDSHHVAVIRANRPEYVIRSDLMQRLIEMAVDGGMEITEMLSVLARVAGIIAAARSVEALAAMEPAQLMREAREIAVEADRAESRAVQRARTRLQTDEGQRALFDAWRRQFAEELAQNPEALAELQKQVAARRSELGAAA